MDSINAVKKLLYRHLKVTLTDGRTVYGDFLSVDVQGAIVIGNAHEEVLTSSGNVEKRNMGMVLVPKSFQKKVELQGTLEEKLRLAAAVS
ncbi:hypothetical protein CEUSTIGMA_g9906.t1 [Chlamydomonas eustigma]|uniref:LSM domain-containing protein n=1 Tax=Chlamydomonas eustigma TaxID=1157962 RepID=A0A250XHT5_9CHLO|nr:hypothetical protein CEUSTIGMA_g9906.t1 [Chlamydomonas eustigma]|eukprot:GAX82479.1 hypothetical protein CEUSTIGMA_g9906.t1 [Chlamydomonas eustigma]